MPTRPSGPKITELPLDISSSHLGAHGSVRCTLPVHALHASCACAARCLFMCCTLPVHALHAAYVAYCLSQCQDALPSKACATSNRVATKSLSTIMHHLDSLQVPMGARPIHGIVSHLLKFGRG